MLHPTLVFRWLSIGYIMGVGVWSFWQPSIWFCLSLMVLFLVIFGRKRFVLFSLAWLIIGGTIGALHITQVLTERIANQVPGCCDQEVVITGEVSAEPAISVDHQSIVVKPIDASSALQSARALVRLPLGQTYNYGDIVSLKCKLNLPKSTDDFAYDKYLMLSNIRATCLASSAKITGRQSSQVIVRLIFQAKRWTTERLQQALPEPQAALMAGLLIGSRSGLPKAVADNFRTSGVSHIVAISGYNITIIASIIFAATCRYIGRTRSFWLVAGVLIVFTVMTGAQASVIRATIMGILALTAKQMGRAGTISGVWLLAGLIMIVVNPMVLAFDAGFQLSFLATAGLIWVSPSVIRKIGWVPEFFGLRDSLASTLSATALTMPIMLCNFKQLSIIAPIVNMLILPVIPPIMAIGTVIVVTAALSATLSRVVGWFGWLGLSYILEVTRWLGNIPFAAIIISQTKMMWLMGGYGAIVFGLIIRKILIIKYKCVKKLQS